MVCAPERLDLQHEVYIASRQDWRKSKHLRTQIFESAHVQFWVTTVHFLWTSVSIIDTSNTNRVGKSHSIDTDSKLKVNREEMRHLERHLCGSIDMYTERETGNGQNQRDGDVPMGKVQRQTRKGQSSLWFHIWLRSVLPAFSAAVLAFL